jgi:pseudouridine-5'-phosphate glycosidase
VNALLTVSPEVAAAVAGGRPVVALETTVVTHGLPSPLGVQTAAAMQEAVRDVGAVPALIGILEGHVHVGLTAGELERLAATPGVVKVNLGNLASTASTGRTGSTTVAATIAVAHRAGIGVMATGGIGGVHRDVAETGDVSADLTALARFPLAVVCSGAKSVLDLPRTFEALETLGVPVYGMGTDRFPAFHRRDSGLGLDQRFDRAEDLAAAVRTHHGLGLGTGVLVGNPVPERDELPRETYEAALDRALADAAREGVRGRAVTPFLLERMRVLTGDQSVATNRALLLDNARVAAELAVALSRLGRPGPPGLPSTSAGP